MQSIALPTNRYFFRSSNRKEWDWLTVTSDPPIAADLKASASDQRYLVQLRLYRDTGAGERILIMHLEPTNGATGLTAGADLSTAFETSGSVTLTLSSGQSITALQRLSGDTVEQYRWDSGDGFDDDEFDAVFAELGTSGTASGTLVIRDYEP